MQAMKTLSNGPVESTCFFYSKQKNVALYRHNRYFRISEMNGVQVLLRFPGTLTRCAADTGN